MTPNYNPYHYMYFRGYIVVAYDGSPISANGKVMYTNGEYVSNGYIRKRWVDTYGCRDISYYDTVSQAKEVAFNFNIEHNKKEDARVIAWEREQEEKKAQRERNALKRKERNAKIISVVKKIIRWGK